MAHAEATGAQQIETTREAEDAWVELLVSGGRSFGADPSCTPGYYNNEGKIPEDGEGTLLGLGYPDGPVAYFDYIAEWRTSGEFQGLAFR